MSGTSLEIRWSGDDRFSGQSGEVELVLDGDARAGPSPMQALAFGLAGCMGIDVVHILRKGRFALNGLRVRLESRRAEEPPRRFESIALHFVVEGDVPEDRVARAIELSRESYCSAWHSLRQDIALETRFVVVRPPVDSA